MTYLYSLEQRFVMLGALNAQAKVGCDRAGRCNRREKMRRLRRGEVWGRSQGHVVSVVKRKVRVHQPANKPSQEGNTMERA